MKNRIAILAVLLLSSCTGISAADAIADRDTLDWATPLLAAHIKTTSPVDQPLHWRALESWRLRVEAKLKAAGVTK